MKKAAELPPLRPAREEEARGLLEPGREPFLMRLPKQSACPVVFASPHSGRVYPAAFLSACRSTLIDVRRIEDAYLDMLIEGSAAAGAPSISGLIGRAVVDLNREETEIDPAMFADPAPEWGRTRSERVEAGLGCFPREAYRASPIYSRKLLRREAEERLEQIHRPYHAALENLLEHAQAGWGWALLVDCHSMPSPLLRSGPEADIVIGDRFGTSCRPEVAEFVEAFFTARGYRTARNAPYAGGYATRRHGRPAEGREAVQIEIARRLYLNEAAVEPHAGLGAVRAVMSELALCLRDFTSRLPRERAK